MVGYLGNISWDTDGNVELGGVFRGSFGYVNAGSPTPSLIRTQNVAPPQRQFFLRAGKGVWRNSFEFDASISHDFSCSSEMGFTSAAQMYSLSVWCWQRISLSVYRLYVTRTRAISMSKIKHIQRCYSSNN